VSDVTPTRTALLELQEERRVMQEGYQFLDEKRLLLAAAMLAELATYRRLGGELERRWGEATAALTAAVARHGLQELGCYPPADLSRSQLRTERRSLLGVVLQEAVLETNAAEAREAVHRSPEAEACRAVFLQVLAQAATAAAVAGNLERLRAEYRQTERRARALENVLLPEIEGEVRDMDERLEEFDREDALRSHHGR
jgi:V/A-type H+-transporting ATPase subunit D